MSRQAETAGTAAGTSKRWVIFALGALLPVTLLAAWQALGDLGYISTILYPTPLTIGQAFVELSASGELWTHLQISLTRAALGFGLGGGLGLLLGIAVGLFRSTEKALDPTVQMLRMVPSLALAPLFVLWFGIGEESKILLIAKGAFFPLYINTYLGIRSVDRKLFDVSRVLAFGWFKQIVRLVLPASMPHVLLGVRLSLGVAWLGLVVAELMASTSGIGYLMSDARQFTKTPVVFVGIAVFAIVGKLTDSLVRYLERRWLRWQDTYKG